MFLQHMISKMKKNSSRIGIVFQQFATFYKTSRQRRKQHSTIAAGLVYNRANAGKSFLGLTNFKGNYITQRDISIAHGYPEAIEATVGVL